MTIDALGVPRSVLVLGGTSDIGLGLAERYARMGTRRIVLAARLSSRREVVLGAFAARVAPLGVVVEVVDFDALDVSRHGQVVEDVFGAGDVDVAVVAFGVLPSDQDPWQDPDLTVVAAQVNYVGAVSVGTCLGRAMRRQGHGSIVALSSVAGERVRRSNFVYGSTKAGMDGFYLGLGEALRGDGVHVLVVRPGFVHTKMTEGRDTAPLSVEVGEVVDAVVKGVSRRSELVWVPGQMRWVMSLLRHLPRAVFRRLPL